MRGRFKSLSLPRRAVADFAWIASGTPLATVECDIAAGAVAAARDASAARPPWTAIFAKAYAMTAREFPALRQAYMKYPWPHLYEYPALMANVIVERSYEGEPVIFGCRINNPADLPIAHIAQTILHFREHPLHEIKDVRLALRVSRWPLLIRRLLWWLAFNVPRQRANYFGTFGLSVLGSMRADITLTIVGWTSFLNYGPLTSDGKMRVRILFDHRVFDGATAARVLLRLEEILNGPIISELEGRADPSPSPGGAGR